MKKAISTLLGLFLLLQMSVSVFAVDGATVFAEAVASEDDSVSVSVQIEQNPGVAAWMFEVIWDSDVFALDEESVEVGAPFSTGTFLTNAYQNGKLLVTWYMIRDISRDGELFSFRLKARAGALVGTYPVSVICSTENTINVNSARIPVVTSGVEITVTPTGNVGNITPGTSTPSPQLPEPAGATTTDQQRPDNSTTGTEEDTPSATGNGDGFLPESPAPERIPFTDVARSSYYYDAVSWALEAGITGGTSETTFSPDARCSRAQMVTFLWRAAGKPDVQPEDCAFTDVPADAYYRAAVLWAAENGITGGTSESTFSPDADVSRAQSATFLWRLAGCPHLTVENPFRDVLDTAYYADAVQWAGAWGITKGTSDAQFSPDASCTRGQIVTFLYRYFS